MSENPTYKELQQRVEELEEENSELQRLEDILETRLYLSEYATKHTVDELLQVTLDEAERLTASSIAFFHFVKADQETLHLQMWSSNTLEKMCSLKAKGSHCPISRAGVWGDCVRMRQPVIHNDYNSLARRKSLPPGHVPVIREAVVPLILEGKVQAIIGVGNKETCYDDRDIEVLSNLSLLTWDIIERKKAEHLLRLSEEKFRTVADYTYNWEYWIGPDEQLYYISPSCERITGYSAADFFDNPGLLYSIIHREDCIRFRDHTRKELNREAAAGLEFRIVTKSGESRWISHSCQPVYDKEGKHSGRRASNRDITQRVEAERALRESERRFRLALDATSDGLWDRNLLTGEVYYGENWARILGYSPEEIREKGIGWEALLHPEDKNAALAAVQDHIDGNTPGYVAEFRMRNKTGQYQWIMARGKVVEWDKDGTPLRFVGTHSDISKRKRAERELLRGNQKIKEFAYSVVHDLKNPSMATYGLAHKLQQRYHEILDEKGRTFCEHIKRSAEQIGNLVDKINTYIATHENPLQIEEVPLQECLHGIHEEFSQRLESRSVILLLPDNLPAIRADKLAILRILRNLVDNALKYGGGKLTAIEIAYRETATHHILAVSDDGVGLKQTELKGIFKKFMRKKTALGIEGTGLGLSVVKEIAGQHKGELWYEQPGKGITFSFSIAKII